MNTLLVIGGAAWHLLQNNRESSVPNNSFLAYLFLFLSIFALVASTVMFWCFVCRGRKDD